MIYIVDGTCYSKATVLELAKRLNANRVSFQFWYAMTCTSVSMVTQLKDTWLFAWDDSPFSGELFEFAMRMGIQPAPNCYYAAINTSRRLLGWSDLLELDISKKFKGCEDHVFLIPSDDDSTLSRICDALLRMDKARRDAMHLLLLYAVSLLGRS